MPATVTLPKWLTLLDSLPEQITGRQRLSTHILLASDDRIQALDCCLTTLQKARERALPESQASEEIIFENTFPIFSMGDLP